MRSGSRHLSELDRIQSLGLELLEVRLLPEAPGDQDSPI